LLMTVAVKKDWSSRNSRFRSGDEGPVGHRVGDQIIGKTSLGGDGGRILRVLAEGQQLVLEREDARRLAPDDRNAGAGSGSQTAHEVDVASSGLLQQPFRDQGAAATNIRDELYLPTGGFEELDRRPADLRLR